MTATHPWNMTLRAIIKRKMSDYGIKTLSELAVRSGVGVDVLSKLVCMTTHYPLQSTRAKLCSALDLDPVVFDTAVRNGFINR